jgi:hypothetical protein
MTTSEIGRRAGCATTATEATATSTPAQRRLMTVDSIAASSLSPFNFPFFLLPSHF